MEHSSIPEKKAYARPILRKLTNEQAKQLIADCKNCSEKEAAEFLSFPRSLAAKAANN
jgi:hypothetical protein